MRPAEKLLDASAWLRRQLRPGLAVQLHGQAQKLPAARRHPPAPRAGHLGQQVPQPSLAGDLLEACRRLLVVYVPYALVFLAALLLRVVPSVDVRSTLNVLVFGPFTLLRPFVGLAGVAWAFAGVPRWQVLGIGVFGIAAMLSLEWTLNRWYARQNRR
jgi:hypothetical protein